MAPAKERLDKLLFDRGLAPSQEKAQGLIMAGQVLVDSRMVDKAGTKVSADAHIELAADSSRYVSRGGEKLEAAIERFRPDVGGKITIDVGASTGGFTDCLLQHGAKKVYAVDVGRGQLEWNLRNDPRVVNLERTNARYLKLEQLAERPQLATIDVSFISLELIIPPVNSVLTDDGEIIALIKPQFEAEKNLVEKGGIIRNPKVHQQMIDKIVSLAGNLNLQVIDSMESPLEGPAGNREFFIYLRK